MSVNQFTTRDVMAASAFLAGASFLLLGTRMVMRLRWVLWLPLLALPVVTEHVLIAVPLVVVVVMAAAVPLLRRPPAGRHAARVAVPPPLAFVLAAAVPLLRRRPAGGHAARVGRRRGPGGTQRLPRLLPAGVFVLVLACILCVSSLPLVPYLVSLL